MTVTYAHLCEKSFLSQNGNLNLIGIFEKISTQKFPMSFPQLSLVTSLQGEPGQHQMLIKIIDVKDQSEISKAISINLNIQGPQDGTQKPQNLRIIGDINNLTIKEAGKYEVQIYLNGDKAYSVPFDVEKATKLIPEGR